MTSRLFFDAHEDRPEPPRREAHVKHGVMVTARLGDPSHPHVLTICGTRHDNAGNGRMELTRLDVELVQALPGGLGALQARLQRLMPLARSRAEEGLGRAGLVLDVTRQPLAWHVLQALPDVLALLVVTTHGRLDDSTPYWHCGRLTLLSSLTLAMARPGVLNVLRPPGDDPTVWQPEQVQASLAAAQVRPPKDEPDQFLSETSTQDDVALALAAAAQWAEMAGPDPWVALPDYSRPRVAA